MKYDKIFEEQLNLIGDDHLSSSAKTPIRDDAFDISDLEKIELIKKDVYNIYENELHPKNVEENEGIKDYTEFDGINDDWEEFNERDTSAKKNA